MTQIIDAYLGLAALRQAGYRSTATAIAELVDNSLEAKANNIEIITISRSAMVSRRTSNQVESIAVLDDGEGMSVDVLGSCLSLGWGTRLESREGLGRFGFGLKGSSISQARRVDVYSWKEPNKVFKVYLDLDEIKKGNLTLLPDVEKTKLPSDVKKCFGDRLGPTGTLVWWSNLDNMDLKRAETLVSRINRDLCRIYRHFLDDCDNYGSKRSINVHLLQSEKQKVTKTVALRANDPLYQLTPNNLVGYENETTNEVYNEPFSINVKYLHNGSEKTSKVEFRFTWAKPSIQNLGGNSVQGKHYGLNTGISFVRAGREIDFGAFGFLDDSDPRHRWWGAEVRFDPELDELFGVTNNKQEVNAIRKLEPDVMEELVDSASHGDFRGALLLDINKILNENISEMMRVIRGRRKDERKAREKRGLADRVNKDVKKSNTPTESSDRAKQLDDKQKLEERVKLLLNDDQSLTADEAKQIAQGTIDYKVDIQTDDWPGHLFLDRRAVANASVGIINRNSKFYEKFWQYLEEHSDKRGFEALEVLMMSLVRAEDELVREYDREVFDDFRARWGMWSEKLIKHAGS
jgi:hypothetical protein